MIKEIVIKAYNFSKKAHDGQKRKFSGLDYFTHPKAVARIIDDLTGKDYLVAAALLHDVLEDTDATYHDLVREFGQRIASLVMELTETPEKRKNLTKEKYLLKAMIEMSEDALTIKFADRYHNIKFLTTDCTDVEQFNFTEYYVEQTIELLTKIKPENEAQRVLYDGMINTIDYIKVKHFRKEK
jgi:GTP pyrophosphokinase